MKTLSAKGCDFEIYLRKNSRTDYGPECLAEFLKFMSVREMLENDLLIVIDSRVKKYFQEHPEVEKQYEEALRQKQGFYNKSLPTKPFLATKAQEIAEFIRKSKENKEDETISKINRHI